MGRAFIGLGSNLGDRLENLRRALAEMEKAEIGVVKMSSIYETEPYGVKNQNSFLNMVVEAQTGLCPRDLLATLLRIEKQMGRKRDKKWGPRIIDLDILFYDDLILDAEDLKIPHPDIANRIFVLLPMFEIAPDYIHPVEKKSIGRLLTEYLSRAGVRILTFEGKNTIM